MNNPTQNDILNARSTFQRLAAQYDKPVNYSPAIENDIAAVKSYQARYGNNPVYWNQIAQLENQVPPNIYRGTVGEYMYACFQPETNTDVACNPGCLNGLKNPNLEVCSQTVYVKRSDGTLVRLHSGAAGSTSAYVYTEPGQNLAAGDLKILSGAGITTVTVYGANGASITYQNGVAMMVPPNGTPTNGVPMNGNTSQPIQPTQTTTTTPTTWNGWAWFWGILILIAIILIIVWIVRSTQYS